MYCRHCGARNEDDAYECAQCGETLRDIDVRRAPAQEIPNYLAPAILTTLFCCLPLGIVAIVYAAQVNGKVAAGDYQGAMDASSNAKTWTWLSFGLGLVGVVIYFLMMVMAENAARRF